MSTHHLETDAIGEAKTSNIQLKHYYRYGACSRGIAVAWALLTLCFMIINIIVFIEPEWIGDTASSRTGTSPWSPGSPGVGYVGLFRLCEFVSFGHERVCDGAFQDFSSILTDAFRASTFFIGVSVLLIFLCVLLFLLFLCVYEVYVFIICGCLQAVSTVFMFLGCVIFPRGWDHMYVRRICGSSVGRHAIGQCEMRWAYILAIIGIFDVLMLAILAFVLAARHRRRWKNIDHVKQKPVADETHGYVVEVAPAAVVGTVPPARFRATDSSYGGERVYAYNQPQHHYAASQQGGTVYLDDYNGGGARQRGVSASSMARSAAGGQGRALQQQDSGTSYGGRGATGQRGRRGSF